MLSMTVCAVLGETDKSCFQCVNLLMIFQAGAVNWKQKHIHLFSFLNLPLPL